MSQKSPETGFQDSAKVLTGILGLLADRNEALATRREAGGTDVAGFVQMLNESTLELISREIQNAPTTTRVFKKT